MTQLYYKASISYDGSHFAGFQIQKNHPTVQGEIEKALLNFTGKHIRIKFAGRTDSGVHALENIISFVLSKNIEPIKLKHILNAILPSHIRINSMDYTDSNFNPRYDATLRVYRYYFYTGVQLIPFLIQKAYCLRTEFDYKKLHEILQIFQGKHDFSAFTTSLETRNPVRIINKIGVWRENDFIICEIQGISYLHKQIRMMIGAGLYVLKNKLSRDDIVFFLNNGKRTKNVEVIPSHGLYLYKVSF